MKYLPLTLLLVLVAAFSQAQPLVQLSDFTYKGAFRLPEGEFGGSRFGYGGTALLYNSQHHALFMVGNAQDQMVAEVAIPEPVIATAIEDLPVATVLQNFTDITEGLIDSAGPDQKIIGGLLEGDGALVGSVYVYYDAGLDQVRSHFLSAYDFSIADDVQGLFAFDGPGAGFFSGYMAEIPAEWQSELGGSALTGNCCIPIISRTSLGPAAFAFNPADFHNPDQPVPYRQLVYYPYEHPLAPWDSTNQWFNGATSIRGAVFPAFSRSLLFFGRQGTGPFCYGPGDVCGDPADPYTGTHAYPYRYQIWAYDALDLKAVAQNNILPWEIRPYALWELVLPFSDDFREIGGLAYAPALRRLYVSQLRVDGPDALPLIHVFELPDYATSAASETNWKPEFEINPNPADDYIRISTNTAQETQMELSILDSGGKVVFSNNTRTSSGAWSYKIDLGKQSVGLYCLRWRTERFAGCRRFLLK